LYKGGDIVDSIQEYLHRFWTKFEHDFDFGGGVEIVEVFSCVLDCKNKLNVMNPNNYNALYNISIYRQVVKTK
jgi:hypothetical protein